MLRYQDPKAMLTLREGLRELRAADTAVEAKVATEFRHALEAHDAVHIVFGLDIGEADEVLAHVWMLAGTTLTHVEMRDIMQDRQHQELATGLGHVRRLGRVVRELPRITAALLRARRMSKRWPWRDYHRHLDRSLAEIRREFGIEIVRRARPSRSRGPHHSPLPTGA